MTKQEKTTLEPRSPFGTLGEIFGIMFSISGLTLGGGLAMLPLLSREFVEKRHWLTEDDMVDTVAAMQSMPGMIAMNMGVLLGYRIAGVPGALSAMFGAALPPFIAIVLLAGIITRCKDMPWLNGAFLGVRSVVAALILLSVVKLAKKICKGSLSIGLAIISFILLAFFDFSAILAIGGGAAIGLVLYYASIIKKRTSQEAQK